MPQERSHSLPTRFRSATAPVEPISLPLFAMDRCPAELWTRIASHACTDGGYTGSSLSLVSRAMYQAVEPVRYHSVSLLGNEQLVDFSARLMALSHLPIIHHLFIADLHVKRGWRSNDRHFNWMNQRLHNVITSSAPNLITLSIYASSFNLVMDDVRFPCLRDLTISSSHLPGAHGEVNVDSRFPVLHRLHILPPFSRDIYGSLTVLPITSDSELWRNMTGYTSRITHLRLSSTIIDGYFLQFLRVLLKMPLEKDEPFTPKDIRRARAAASQLPALRYLFVQVRRLPQPLCYYCNAVVTDDVQEKLAAICEVSMHEDNVGNVKLVLLPERIWGPDYNYRDAYADWRSVIESTDGPWTSAPETLENSISSSVHDRREGSVSPAHYVSPPHSPPGPISPRIVWVSGIRRSPPFSVATPPVPSVVASPAGLPTEETRRAAQTGEAELSRLAAAFTSLQGSIAMSNQVHRLDRRLASETSARKLCLSLQLIATDPAVRVDLQRRVDQHNEAIADLERELSAAEGRLRETDVEVADSVNAAATSLREQFPRLPSVSPELESLHDLAAEPGVVAGDPIWDTEEGILWD